jgi:uncharacterized protein YaaQ
MKLAITIIQDEFTNKVMKALMAEKIRSTRLSSTGGFLKSGNTTLLIGVDDDKVDFVIDLIKSQCQSTKIKNGDSKVTVGGANIFIMDIDKHMRI